MPSHHNFEHLPLVLTDRGPARLGRPGRDSPQTRVNRNVRQAHSNSLATSAQSRIDGWKELKAERERDDLPYIPEGIPILLQVDTSLELDVLREKFNFEIVAEQEEGYVIVAAEDIELTPFLTMVKEFAVQVHGSATIARVHKLFDDPDQADRLARILSDHLLDLWPNIGDDQEYIVDVGIACTGTQEIPSRPTRGKTDDDPTWARKELAWAESRIAAYDAWDEVKRTRETQIEQFASSYNAEILHLVDQGTFDSAVLPDSFTVRLRILGKGLRDFVLSYPFIFEVVEPDDISLPPQERGEGDTPEPPAPVMPDDTAPAVCVIDSGIQENHVLLEPAIDHPTSYCFLPGKNSDDVGDFVQPGGHGTRVAGAVLYGETIIRSGTSQLPFWIQNARVLDEHNTMPEALFPPATVRASVTRFHEGPRNTRIFNHSINATTPCRTRYMSAWAAEIDMLCATRNILFVQSAGNIPISGVGAQIGVKDHLEAGRHYPLYLYEPSTRVANPAQSLHALTVGSIAYGSFEANGWKTFADQESYPSAFSRSGLGIWKSIKPEVVEYAGDDLQTASVPPEVQAGGQIPAACPELVRSTMFPPGPLYDRDETGTSFAAPKVARIGAAIQKILPDEPALLYRALIVQSARWPNWAENVLRRIRQLRPYEDHDRRLQLIEQASRIVRLIGYGVPDESRATENTHFRTTFITNGETTIRPRDCHIYEVRIPDELIGPVEDHDTRIEVTLSYVAEPRRTRMNPRRYLSTWVDWKSSRLGEDINHFRKRVLKDAESEANDMAGEGIPWTLQERSDAGLIRDVRRNSGTVQKDWAIVDSGSLPAQFCIAVVGHPGWSHDPDSMAHYALVVTLEILDQQIRIYEPLRTAAIELQAEIEAEVEEAEIPVEE